MPDGLAHHVDPNRKFAFLLAAIHLVRKSVIIVKAHLLDGGDATGVKHGHVVAIRIADFLKR